MMTGTNQIQEIQQTHFDQRIKEHTSTIVYLTDLLIADLAQLDDKQQRFVIGLKDGITQFLTIYHQQKNRLKSLSIGSYDCTFDLLKLVRYISVCCARLFPSHWFPLPTETQRKIAEKINEVSNILYETLRDWQAASDPLIEPVYRKIEQIINELMQGEGAVEDEQLRRETQNLQDVFKKMSDYMAIYFRELSRVNNGELYRTDFRKGVYFDTMIGSEYVLSLQFLIQNLSKSAKHITLSNQQNILIAHLTRAARVFDGLWLDVMNIQRIVVGVISTEMPILNSSYD